MVIGYIIKTAAQGTIISSTAIKTAVHLWISKYDVLWYYKNYGTPLKAQIIFVLKNHPKSKEGLISKRNLLKRILINGKNANDN